MHVSLLEDGLHGADAVRKVRHLMAMTLRAAIAAVVAQQRYSTMLIAYS
jgi:hypothetical protein